MSRSGFQKETLIKLKEYWRTKIREESYWRRFTMSSRFAYKMTKSIDFLDRGTTLWWGCRSFKVFGICRQELCPEEGTSSDEEYLNVSVSQEAIDDGYNHRAYAYRRLYTIEDTEIALCLDPGIMLSFDIFPDTYDAPEGKLTLPIPQEKSDEIHSVFVYGYDRKEEIFKFSNSWGKEWGDEGNGTIPYDYFKNGLIPEAWTILSEDKWHKHSIKIFEEIFNAKDNKKYTIKQFSIKREAYGYSGQIIIDIFNSENKICGWAHINPRSIDDFELEEIYLLPKYQNIGLGKKILEIIDSIAKNFNAIKIYGYISSQDIIREKEERVKDFFLGSGYSVILNYNKFRDCRYKIEKLSTINT
ncbi:MAG: GNAT family N-acetyltransferase [Dehalococcoidales bacterium]